MGENKEQLLINKERTWVFAPVNNVAIKVTVEGEITASQIEEAIHQAVETHEIFSCRVQLDQEGKAFFMRGEKNNVQVITCDKDWQTILQEEEKRPFAIWQGEFMRFFILPTPKGKQLLMIAHHLAGDGISYAYLLQDIMKCLKGEQLSYKPLQLFSMSDLPKESKLSFLMNVMMKYMNKKWQKKGKIFSEQDFYGMATQYWHKHCGNVYTHIIKEESYTHLLAMAKMNGITINTLLATCFFRAANEKTSMGQAVSIRKAGYEGMGNFATGISVDYYYDDQKDFWENAKQVQSLTQEKLQDPKKKFFLLQFLGHISGTLQDAVYFSSCGGYENQTAKTFSKMFGYEGNPKGISMTNLTKVPIQADCGKWQLKDFTFIPPLVLNIQRILGIASLGEEMVITCHLDENSQLSQNVAFFEKGINFLTSL